ncbi:3D domain-containing protein [Deinococcus sp. QL22]|uniref:3D domain-containing protein n=1 Tax=Deinococcus sp. QL22 TaxID=2939437 RepID=UPI0020181DBA|nr:3D domain-containing protein [Deinococcus sp. QL22]UQN06414.1 3D domain-containing protein [Deinococcus sp. QL22]
MLKMLNRFIHTFALLTLGVAAAVPALPAPELAADAVKDVLTVVAPAATAPAQAVAPRPAAAPTAAQPTAAQNRAAAVAQVTRATPARPATPVARAVAPVRAVSAPLAQAAPVRTGRTAIVRATAYNSLAGQTDSTPFITATGTRTRPGVVALSRDLLRSFPYGSKIMLEDMSGRYNNMLRGRVFVVEDTMAARKTNSLDIWMGTRSEAIQFGARTLRITAVR